MIRATLKTLTLLSAVVTLGCTQPRQTTAVGAAAGGAIGAGLGAIIGNQTGNAGSGVAIGAVAGAATGALVANALQAQQESLRSQDEALERQERLLQVQRSEITELRNMNPDVVEKKRVALQRRGPEPTYYRSAALRSSDPFATSSTTRARLDPKSLSPAATRKSPTPMKPSATKTSASNTVGPVKVKAIPFETQPEPKVAPKTPLKPQVIEPKLEDLSADSTETARLDASSAESTCENTATEQRAAAAASDPSDKLLHLRKALRLCPNSAELHHELGKVYSSMNRSTDASHEFKEALKVDPTFSAATLALNELKAQEIDQRF